MANGFAGLVKGFRGKPSHPPLTDASIGAYTAAVAMLVAGALGLEEEEMAHGALLALGAGLAVALPTALTGLLDWLDLRSGTPARTMATVHLITMLTATILFALTFVFHLDGYRDGEVETLGLILGLAAEGLLIAGGYIGGSLVFVYGVRVLKHPDTPVADALRPSVSDDAPQQRTGPLVRPPRRR